MELSHLVTPTWATLRRILLTACIAPWLTGCATLFSNGPDELTFTSDVGEVQVYLDGQLVGRTPLTIDVERDMQVKGALARFERDGFETQEFRLKRQFNNVAIINLTSLPSWATDVLSGAWFEYEPLKYHVELEPASTSARTPEFVRRRQVHRFVVLNFERLRQDLSRGGGPYLRSLAAAMSTSPAEAAGLRDAVLDDRSAFLGVRSRTAFLRLLSEHRADWRGAAPSQDNA